MRQKPGASRTSRWMLSGRSCGPNAPGIVAPNGASEHGQALTGLVEDIEGDAVVVRIGGSVVLLDVDGEPPLGVVGTPVTVRPSAFELWPTGL